MRQKLISIPFYFSWDSDRKIQEQLSEYLDDGWVVKSMISIGSAAGGGESSCTDIGGWALVLVEKNL